MCTAGKNSGKCQLEGPLYFPGLTPNPQAQALAWVLSQSAWDGGRHLYVLRA